MTHSETMPLKPMLTFEEVSAMADELEALKKGVLDLADRLRGRAGVDQRWLSIGVTDFEKGLMFIGKEIIEGPLNHAIASEEG